MIRCTAFHKEEAIKTYELDDKSITIGRLPENTISIANMGISRRHARIELTPERTYVLSDLNSLNGTYLNNQKVKKSALHTGDKIGIGKFTILFEDLREDPNAPVEVTDHPQPLSEPALPDEISETKQPDAEPEPAPVHRTHPVLIDTSKHLVYQLDKPLMSIGTSENDDIFVAGFMIGDGHVHLEKKEDGFWLEARKLMGRIKVNGRKTNSHCLEHKDRIEIGNSVFRFMENG